MVKVNEVLRKMKLLLYLQINLSLCRIQLKLIETPNIINCLRPQTVHIIGSCIFQCFTNGIYKSHHSLIQLFSFLTLTFVFQVGLLWKRKQNKWFYWVTVELSASEKQAFTKRNISQQENLFILLICLLLHSV